jgi:hypothetical protein
MKQRISVLILLAIVIFGLGYLAAQVPAQVAEAGAPKLIILSPPDFVPRGSGQTYVNAIVNTSGSGQFYADLRPFKKTKFSITRLVMRASDLNAAQDLCVFVWVKTYNPLTMEFGPAAPGPDVCTTGSSGDQTADTGELALPYAIDLALADATLQLYTPGTDLSFEGVVVYYK